MSADLLAAFGRQSLEARNGETLPEDAGRPSETNIITMPNETRLRQSHAANLGNTEQSLWKQDPEGIDILFDASVDEDDFGDFETPDLGISAPRPQSQINDDAVRTIMPWSERTSPHLLPSDTSSHEKQPSIGALQPLIEIEPSANGSWDSRQTHDAYAEPSPEDEWGTFEDAVVTAASDKKAPLSSTCAMGHAVNSAAPNGQAKVEVDVEDEQWDEFEDGPVTDELSDTALAHAAPIAGRENALIKHMAILNTSDSSRSRPTNIPPPFTLLQMLPKAYQNLATLSKSLNMSTSTQDIAHLVVQTYRTTAHIIAGRSHRWKRDTHLSQSMRISQAGVKTSGMKLTSLDKGESVKEDQQVLEVVNHWSRHAHVFNATMARGGVRKPPKSLSINMGVKTATGPGILTAKDMCCICGLRRNERVLGIDIDVEDTFGAFWTEYWGHKDCYDVWYRHSDLLEHR